MKYWIQTTLVFAAITAWGASPSWQARMGELSKALSDAIPYLYPDPSVDPKGLSEKIRRIDEVVKKLDGKLDHSLVVPDSDPSLPYIAKLLREDIARARQSVEDGHVEYGKSVVRSSVAYCIACHTRSREGVEFPLLKAFAEPLKRASWIERIEFQAASRQFEPVLTEVMKKLEGQKEPGLNALDLERGARIALSVAVRVKSDPERARLLAQAMLASPGATPSMKEAAKSWLRDIADWKSKKGQVYSSDKDMIRAARELVGEPASADRPALANSEVKYLLASVLMHEMIKKFPASPNVAEGMYLIGVSYDALRELGLWSLHEMYFLACIDRVPHTKQAEECFDRYEQSVTLGYTGSSGVNIPRAVRTHLASVRQKAALPKKK